MQQYPQNNSSNQDDIKINSTALLKQNKNEGWQLSVKSGNWLLKEQVQSNKGKDEGKMRKSSSLDLLQSSSLYIEEVEK